MLKLSLIIDYYYFLMKISLIKSIMGTTEGNMTDDIQGGREIDHQISCICLEYKSMRHHLQKHKYTQNEALEDRLWLSNDVQHRSPARGS